jgi:O-glycosyl hydrolase
MRQARRSPVAHGRGNPVAGLVPRPIRCHEEKTMKLVDTAGPLATLILLLAAHTAAAQTVASQTQAVGAADAGLAEPSTQPTAKRFVATIGDAPQQIMTGWGSYSGFYRHDWAPTHNFFERPYVHQAQFVEMKQDLLRVEIPYKAYAEKDDGSLDTDFLDKGLVRHLKIARRHGIESYLISNWSPPKVMKDPPTNSGRQDEKDKKPVRLRPEREQDYVDYFVKVIQYLQAQGLSAPVAVSIQNEPNYAPKWDGCVYEPEQYRRVAILMRKALDGAGLQQVKLVGPEGAGFGGNISHTGGVSGLRQHPDYFAALDIFAFHGYGDSSRSNYNANQIRDIARHFQEAGKEVWMTEWCVNKKKMDSMDYAMQTAQRIGRDMAYIGANRWIYWMMWHPTAENVGALRGIDPQFTRNKAYFVFQPLFNHARAGSAVMLVETDDPQIRGYHFEAVEAIAFDRPECMVVMLVNPAAASKPFTVKNLPGATVEVLITDASRDAAAAGSLAIANRSVEIDLPPRSITFMLTDRGRAQAAQ